jgi:hypothetical protein
MKKSFLMYADGYETLKYLTDEQLGKLTRMMFEYFLNGNTCDPSDPLFFVFNPIKLQMDRDVEKYSKVLEVRRESGKKGGEAKASKSYQMLANGKDSLANVADKDTVTVKDTDTDTDTEKVKDSIVRSEPKPKSFKQWTVEDFKNSIADNRLNYTSEMLNSFFGYWTELNALGKPKFTTEKTWETHKRLKRWHDNNNKFTPTKPQPTQFNRSSANHYV